MKPWTASQCAFSVEQYFQLGESVVAVRHAFKIQYKLKDTKILQITKRWVKNFREKAEVTPKR